MEFYDYENYVSNLKKENAKLDKDFKAMHRLWKKAMDRENNLIEENKQLKQEISDKYNEIINLKTEIGDHRIKEYRLLKILNETSDYTE